MRSGSRPLTAALIVVLLCLAMAGAVEAKGGPSYLRGATISGGELQAPVHSGISIPDQSWEMRPLHAPANGLFAGPFELFMLYQTAMPYEVVLHYDYERWGGETNREAYFDGESLLYLPSGNWYEASPRLARTLRNEIFWGLVPADVRGVRGGGIDGYTTEVLLVLGAAVLLTLGHRVWQGTNEVASPVEVEARMRNRELPDPLVHF